MKALFVSLILLVFSPGVHAGDGIIGAMCKLTMESINPHQSVTDPKFWLSHAANAIDYGMTRLYVDRFRNNPPEFNQKYNEKREQLLTDFHFDAKRRDLNDVSQYLISTTMPQLGEGVLDYMIAIANAVATVYYSTYNDSDHADLVAVNSVLNSMSAFNPDTVILLVSELEVLHPKEFSDLKHAVEFHRISQLNAEIKNIDFEIEHILAAPTHEVSRIRSLEQQRGTLLKIFITRRNSLYDQLLKKGLTEELITAIALFGPKNP